MRLTKAIITAAGNGTRFLPTTKIIQKEMLPLVDVPIVHEIVKECIDAGFYEIIIVIKTNVDDVPNYFEKDDQLLSYLKKHKKLDRYKRFQEIDGKAKISYVTQPDNLPYGNGSPIIAAQKMINPNEAFAVLWGDDVVLSKEPGIGQLKEYFSKLERNNPNIGGVIGTTYIQGDEISKYASVGFKDSKKKIINKLVEKPDPDEAPSQLASYGRYILTYDLFKYLTPNNIGKDGEVWLADAIARLASKRDIYAHNIKGQWMTTGDPLRYLKTLISYALKRNDIGEELRQFIQSIE